MVSPCFEKIHYRLMKDPFESIQYNSLNLGDFSLGEFHRLDLPKNTSANVIQLVELVQIATLWTLIDLFRAAPTFTAKCFCECGGWDSKFKEDRD